MKVQACLVVSAFAATMIVVSPCDCAFVTWSNVSPEGTAPIRDSRGSAVPGATTFGDPVWLNGALVQLWKAMKGTSPGGVADIDDSLLAANQAAAYGDDGIYWKVDDVLLDETHCGYGTFGSPEGAWSQTSSVAASQGDTIYVRAYNVPKPSWAATPLQEREIGIRNADGAVVSYTLVRTDVPLTFYFDNLRTEPLPQKTLTMAVSPGGVGETTPPIGNHVYDHGAVVNVDALAVAGWVFDHWGGPVDGPATLRQNTVTMDADKALTAFFKDVTAPLLGLLGANPVGLQVGTPYIEPGYAATDNYDGDITARVVVTGSVNYSMLGTYILRYNVTDSSGNPAEEKTRTVNVVDATVPMIILSGANLLTFEVGTAYTEPGYEASDNYDGDITARVVVSGSVNHAVLGSYMLRYSVLDSSGNPAEEKTRTVNVVDTTVPVITLSGDNPMILEVGTSYVEPGCTASDNHDEDITARVVVSGSVNDAVPGEYTLSYNVSDSSGNDAEEKVRIVNVVETAPPVITLLGATVLTLEVGTVYTEPGYEATDNYDGDITASVMVTGSVNHAVLGSYTLRYSVVDSSGNPAEEKTRTVNVVDTTVPVITLSGDNPMILEVGTSYVEPGCTASDNHDEDITARVVVSGSVSRAILGSYILRYNVSDSSGNPAEEKTRVLNVVHTTPFDVIAVVEVAVGIVGITWSSREGVYYSVWSCPDLLTRLWEREATVASQGATTIWNDPAATPVRKFYRIMIE